MDKKYRYYFQINEHYIPCVDEDVIRTQPELWKNYYPHESFVSLLNQAKLVLTNTQRMSIWVEGAYGTGKSHAILTLKKLLDCSNDELLEYFDRYKGVLSKDLYNEFYSLKNQDKKILTVHRMGSSEVKNDRILMMLVQESIISALKENGYTYFGNTGLKDAMIEWLSKDTNRNYFNSIISEMPELRNKFDGKNADAILNDLKTFVSESSLENLIDKISYAGECAGIIPFTLSKEDLKKWILDVIDKNNLKSIFFIWDEFSDYFDLNKANLSGFQFLAQISESYPFYLAIVTHKSDIFFENTKDDVRTKINGRFISPHVSIELPDNIAFVLTGHAMQKVNDKAILDEWEDIVDTLYDMTHDSRKEVLNIAKIGEKELKGVLPIHPYAALVLKHIASAFDSNQRSMFDFIKNNRGDDIEGFQWYIDNYGPEDNNNLLTIDMLWDFFYEKGKEFLAPQIRSILDVFGRTESHNLMANQKKVLKTILLLQAINEKVGDSVPLFVPNDRNIGMAFEGTDISMQNAISLAQSLVREQIIFVRPMGGGKSKYSALISSGNLEEIEKEKDRLRKETHTDKIIEEGEFVNDFRLPKYLELRYPANKLLTCDNIKMQITQLKSDAENHPNRLYSVYTFARNEDESNRIRNEIEKTLNDGFDKIIFVDYSSIYMSNDLYNSYIDNMANCNYQKGKDQGQARTYDRNAKDAIRRWKILLKNSSPRVFSINDKVGTICDSDVEVFNLLKEFDRSHFEYAIETYVTVLDTMFASNNLKLGAECGITGELKGTFKTSDEIKKLEKQFSGVWNVDKYWENRPNELVSRMKNAVEKEINDVLERDTRISISDIYDVLVNKPFGFMPCNLSAFILGYILKEYANDAYNWTDDITTVPMSTEKLKEMIDEIIKQQQNPNPKYRNKYIVAMSPEQREFNKNTAFVFGIDESYCSSIENTRSRMRSQMTSFKFPIWTLKYININCSTDKKIIENLIDLYVELANNSASSRSETDIALDVGKLYISNNSLAIDFKELLTKENCDSGMLNYITKYKDGVLIELARSIGDSGSFVNDIHKKFSEASNWLWNKETVDEKIDETIIEHKIVFESNKYIIKTSNYLDCLKEWSKKCDSFKIAYNSYKNEAGDLDSLLMYLYQIKRYGLIYDSDKDKFLDSLINNSNGFKSFCENQLNILKKIGELYFEGLTDEDVNEIAVHYLSNVYVMENSEFLSKLESSVKEYKDSMAKYKLIGLWKEKTGTDNPIAWSEKYRMPILCMVSPSSQEEARLVFDVINNINNDSSKIDDAIAYLNRAKFYDDFKNSEVRDENFKKYVLKQYSTLITSLEDVKDAVSKKYPNIPYYYWLGNSAIDEYISSYAFQKYNSGGSSIVNDVIDSMSAEDLKVYLKKLVKENMIVGIEIIKNKK